MGCFGGRIQNVPKSVWGTPGPDGNMRTGEAMSNSICPPGLGSRGLRLGLCEPLQAACGSAGAGAAAAGVAATVLGNPLEASEGRTAQWGF